jgi:hypothetical protein
VARAAPFAFLGAINPTEKPPSWSPHSPAVTVKTNPLVVRLSRREGPTGVRDQPACDTNRFSAAGAVDKGLVSNAYLAMFANWLILDYASTR